MKIIVTFVFTFFGCLISNAQTDSITGSKKTTVVTKSEVTIKKKLRPIDTLDVDSKREKKVLIKSSTNTQPAKIETTESK